MKRVIGAFLATLAVVTTAFALPSAWQPVLWTSAAVHDGISLDFATGQHYTKAVGAPARYAAFQDLFTVTRNSVGTYRAQSGLVTYANENLWLQSQTGDDVAWTKTRLTVTANSVTAPDGTTTAETLVEDGTATSTHHTQQSIAPTGFQTTISGYIKAANRSWVAIQIGGTVSSFNVSTCVVGTTSGATTTAISVGNGWCRISSSIIATTVTAAFFIGEADNDITFSGLSQDALYIWGAQLQRGSSAGTYLPTVAAAKYDQPRYEFDVNGVALGYLSEATRTNLALQSEDFSTSSSLVNLRAFGSGSTVNAIASPDGAVTGDHIVEDTTNGQHRIVASNIAGLTAATIYAASVFVKAEARTRGRLAFYDSTATDGVYAEFNLTAATITGSGVFGAGTLTASGIEAFANGWYRVWVAGAMNNARTTGTHVVNLYDAAGTLAYTGDNASGMYVWGRQLEVGQFPSSHIPTTTVSVARAADGCIRTLGSEFSATAGTATAQFRTGSGQDAASGQGIYAFDDGTSNESVRLIRVAASDIMRLNFVDGGAPQFTPDNSIANLTKYKSATAWQVNDYAHSFNGAAVVVDGTGTLGTTPSLYIGGIASANGHILRFDYWPVRKPNDFLVTQSTPRP